MSWRQSREEVNPGAARRLLIGRFDRSYSCTYSLAVRLSPRSAFLLLWRRFL